MILTITLNPCIDKSSTTPQLRPESKLRCSEIVHEAGGGGINVSKALLKLNVYSSALFPAGGHNGAMLQDLLRQDNIPFTAIDTSVETRENWIVNTASDNQQYRFTFPGNAVEEACVVHLIDTIRSFSPSYVVASGSLPPGLPDYFYGLIAKTANAAGARCIVDTSGPALQALQGKKAYLIKPNIGELSRMLKAEKMAVNEVDDAAQQAIENGYAEVIVVSMGAQGAWLVTAREKYLVQAPPVTVNTTVGAGDSMVAGMTYMLQKNATLKEVVQFGVACGSAATMNSGSQLFHAEDAYRLFDLIRNQ
ncbi:MAG: 1-phosphofructokinase family hexose kinase [Bacteroidetes bacterium]|nr:MAG: 1-phosphofructokinase family hexose kinase [Bacteroidota bacterium]